jgi:hypothetical protein
MLLPEVVSMTDRSSRPHGRQRRAARLAAWLAAFVIISCSGDPLAPLPDGFGRFTGIWDGDSWSGLGYAVIRNDTLFLVGHRPDPKYYHDEYVDVSTPFTGTGTYTIDPAEGHLSMVVGGDAGFFRSASGILSVTRYESESRTLEGTVSLVAASASATWTFEDGRFRVPIYDDFGDVPRPPCKPAIRCEGP